MISDFPGNTDTVLLTSSGISVGGRLEFGVNLLRVEDVRSSGLEGPTDAYRFVAVIELGAVAITAWPSSSGGEGLEKGVVCAFEVAYRLVTFFEREAAGITV